MMCVTRRNLLRGSVAGVAGLAGCGFNSPHPYEHEFSLIPYDDSLFNCDGHAFRLTGSDSRLQIDGQLPPIDQSCRDVAGEVYLGPEGLAFIVEITITNSGLLSWCSGETRPVQYTITIPSGLGDGLSSFFLDHIVGDETEFDYYGDAEEMSLPVEQTSC